MPIREPKRLDRPTHRNRGKKGFATLNEQQLEQRSRLIERAIKCLDSSKFEEFWERMDIINRYTRQCIKDEGDDYDD